jgi:hypothetical protein
MKLHGYFKHFLTEKVNLNQHRIDTLDARVIAVGNFLQGSNGFGEDVEDLIAQGSYAQKTIIRPVGNHEFDADVLMPIAEQEGWEPKDYVGQLYTKLKASQHYGSIVGRQSRCVLINYANDFHMDVVPYLVRDDGHWITNRITNRLENTNPEGFNQWLDERDRITGRRLVEVIRLMKYLRDFKQRFSVRSVVLSFLLAEQISESRKLLDPGCYKDLPTAFVSLIKDLDAWLQARSTLPFLTDPSCPTQNFHDRWTADEYRTFRDRIHYYAAKADAAYNLPASAGVDASVTAWQAIFGDGFCKPPGKKAVEASLSLTRASDNEQDLQADLHIPIDTSAGYKVGIQGRVRKHGHMGAYFLAKRGNRVHKDRTIDFSFSTNTVPPPYKVYWKVKNYGAEAEKADCLRGQIVHTGAETRAEPTRYRGNHYVEVYVVKDGRCVALNRQRVVVL